MNRTQPIRKFQDFSIQLYQRESNRVVVRLLWAFVVLQFPIGFALSYTGLFYVGHMVFVYNALILTLINLGLMYIIRHNYDIKRIKIYLVIFVTLAAGEMVYTYINDIALQMIWVFPVIIASLYFDQLMMKLVLAISIGGLLISNFISPITYYPDRFADLYLTSIVIIFGLMVGIYLSFTRLMQVKNAINGMVVSVTSGTSIINHSIKNEIVTIDMLLNSIERSDNKEKRDELLWIAKDTTKHLMQLVEKIQEHIHEINVELVPTNLSELIRQCMKCFEYAHKEQGIIFKSDIDEELIIPCDPIHFREMVFNLLKNAEEAIGGGTGRIEVGLKTAGSAVVLSVRDNGCGISKDNLPHIVDPFFSLKRKSKTNFGLGLTYCYSVVQGHHGIMDVESELKKGTCVWIKIPSKATGVRLSSGRKQWQTI